VTFPGVKESVGRPEIRTVSFIPWVALKSVSRLSTVMKQIHIWPHHIRVPHLDLVLFRHEEETLCYTLAALARLGFDTRPANVEVHGEAAKQ
jgi:hypothetical protein